MRTILLVCTGNLCRSPMAAAILRARLREDPACADWEVHSAGLWATEGQPASAPARAVMEERGYDLSHHRSRPVTEESVERADLILAMTPHHVEALRLAFPQAADRIHLLAEMAGGTQGVDDPYGQPLQVYRAVADELTDLIRAGYGQIVRLARLSTSEEER